MKRKKNIVTPILVLLLLTGLSLLLYPSVSNYVNSFSQSKAVFTYNNEVNELEEDALEEYWREAQQYNQSLVGRTNPYLLGDTEKERYEQLLNTSGNGVMGIIEIPEIKCELPIYHGTSSEALAAGVGHLEWTSLPVGGESTHCVLSSHRGLPSAELFSNLDRLSEGDIFILYVLDEVLTYEVDQILIVEPEDTEALLITQGEDYCTLLTCTPYGVNTHRLLVRGHRVENAESGTTIRVAADAVTIEPVIVASILAIPMILILLVILFVYDNKKKNKKKIEIKNNNGGDESAEDF